MGAFTDFLDFIDRPGQVVRNVLSGNIEGAFRQSASFAGDIIDAHIPFDVIPDFAREEDRISGSQLIGLDENDSATARFIADLGIGILTDPISYLTGGFSAAGKLAAGAARASKIGAAAASAPKIVSLAKTGGKAFRADLADTAVAGRIAVNKLKNAPGSRENAIAALTPQIGRAAAEKAAPSLTAVEQTMKELRAARNTAGKVARKSAATSEQLEQLIISGNMTDVVRGSTAVNASEPIKLLRAAERAALNDRKVANIGIKQLEKQIAGEAAEATIAAGGLRAAKGTLLENVESALTNAGRKKLAKQGPETIQATVARVVAQVGDDVSKANINKVLKQDEFKGLFQTGGLRIGIPFGASKQIIAPETIQSAIGKVGDVLSPIGKFTTEKLAKNVPDSIKNVIKESPRVANNVWEATKSTLGWNFFDNAAKAIKKGPIIAGGNAARRSMDSVGKIFSNIDNQTDIVIAQVFDNIAYQEGRAVSLITQNTGDTVDDLIRRLDDIAENPNLTDVQFDKIDFDAARIAIQQLDSLNRAQWEELINVRAVGQPIRNGDVNLALGAPANINTGRASFLTRVFKENADQADLSPVEQLRGLPKTLKKRSLQTDDDLLIHLQTEGATQLERSAARRAAVRASQQGSVVARADLTSKLLLNKSFILNDPTTMIAVERVIKQLSAQDPKFGKWIEDAYDGVKPRGDLSKIIAGVNRVFKPAAVYGFIVPRFAAITGNEIGGIWQAASKMGPQEALREARNIGTQLWGAVSEGVAKVFGKTPPFQTQMAKDLNKVDNAFANSGGSHAVFREGLEGDKFLLEAVDNGVLDTFTSTEQLLTKIFQGNIGKKFYNLLDLPGNMFQHIEAGLRLGMFRSLRTQGMSAKVAAQHVSDSFLDYSIQSINNRRMRDIIPFAAFISQSIPQQAALIARRPAVAVGLSQVFQTGDEELPEFLQNQATIPFGKDENGDPVVISSLRLPIEALEIIPNISGNLIKAGRDVEREIVGSSQPLIKTAISAVTGRDPFFGGPAFQFNKAPQALQALGADERGEAGRLFNIARGLGVTQPIVSVVNLIERATDPRRTDTQKAIALLTGVRIATVDPEAARLNNLRTDLLQDRQVGQSVNFFNSSGSAETQATIDAFNQAKARLRQKRKDAAVIVQ